MLENALEAAGMSQCWQGCTGGCSRDSWDALEECNNDGGDAATQSSGDGGDVLGPQQGRQGLEQGREMGQPGCTEQCRGQVAALGLQWWLQRS